MNAASTGDFARNTAASCSRNTLSCRLARHVNATSSVQPPLARDDTDVMPGEMEPDTAPSLLRLADLRRALTEALDAVEKQMGDSIDLSQVPHLEGHYWYLDPATAYAMDDDPGLRISVGQTSDDIETLAEMLADPEMHDVVGHSMGHLAELLRILAFVDNPKPAKVRPTDRPQPAI